MCSSDLESRIGWTAVALVAQGKGFVDQPPPWTQGVAKGGEQGTVQIVGDDDRVESRRSEWPGRGFEIRLHRLDTWLPGQPRKRLQIIVHGKDAMTEIPQKQRMAAAAARQVENQRSRHDAAGVQPHPGRGFRHADMRRLDRKSTRLNSSH